VNYGEKLQGAGKRSTKKGKIRGPPSTPRVLCKRRENCKGKNKGQRCWGSDIKAFAKKRKRLRTF